MREFPPRKTSGCTALNFHPRDESRKRLVAVANISGAGLLDDGEVADVRLPVGDAKALIPPFARSVQYRFLMADSNLAT